MDSANETGDAPVAAGPAPKRNRLTIGPALAAALVWAIGTPVGIALTNLQPWTGFGVKMWGVALTAGIAGAIVILFFAVRRASGWLAGAAAGFFGVWLTMVLTAALRGTPFPFYGLIGDAGRIAAMATRYSTSWASADPFLIGVPAEYPPLFPWVIGRASEFSGIPAWQLIGQFEAIFTGLAIVLGFVLWQRLIPPWHALAVTAIGFMVFAIPAKSYELSTLMTFIPWVLGTFGKPDRGRLHWLVSGIAGGFILLTYYGWGIFGIFAILGLGAYSWWTAKPNRKEYLLYLAKAGAVAFVLSSWFTVPFFYAKFSYGGPTIGDLYGTAGFLDQMFPFLELSILGLLQLTGLVGMIWLRGKVWWATPLLAIVVGAYVYRAVTAIMFVLTDHTGLGQYTSRLYMTTMVMAGVLTLIYAVPKLLERLSLTPPKHAGLMVLSMALIWCGFTFTMDWMPKLHGRYADYTERAYREPLPDGRYLIDMTGETPTPWFPVTPLKEAVEKVYGPNPQHVALTVDERLFSYLPWPGYVGNDLGGSLMHTYEKHAELKRISALTTPAEFAKASADTAYGPIDIFVLSPKDGKWQWTAHLGFGQEPLVISFDPSQFDPATWEVVDLPGDYVAAIRRPA